MKTINDAVAVIRAADSDKPSAETRKMLDDFLRSSPDVWRAAGDMVEQSARNLIKAASGKSYAVNSSMTHGWEQLPIDLARPGDGELERLLIQQVVISWLHLGYIEYQYSAMTATADVSIKRAEYWERRLSAAQRRYLRATETLARVRRLQLPAVQVNIGAQQVNTTR